MNLSHEQKKLYDQIQNMPRYALDGQKSQEIQKVIARKVQQRRAINRMGHRFKWGVTCAAILCICVMLYKNNTGILPALQSTGSSILHTSQEASDKTKRISPLDAMSAPARVTFQKFLTAFSELQLYSKVEIEEKIDFKEKRIYDVTLEKGEDKIASMVIDKATGQLESFNRFKQESDSQTALSVSEAQKKATLWLKRIDEKITQDYTASHVESAAQIGGIEGKKPTNVILSSIVQFKPVNLPETSSYYAYFVTLDAQGELLHITFKRTAERSEEVEHKIQTAWNETMKAFALNQPDWVTIGYFEMRKLLHQPPKSLGNPIEAAYLLEIAEGELIKHRIRGDIIPLLLVHPTQKRGYLIWKRENGNKAAIELNWVKGKWVSKFIEKKPKDQQKTKH
ncbi:hypothetical protein NW801_07320 [Brevibacillus laterosporus]|uniref:PepSY domain-containing protein n=1 Tax=Brevibacillus halotolerans TaxID=1507437 RepID=A0ABT4HUY7_9BACL|nr:MULTISPECIES: hypothetical protein [Brevibacillus]MCR8984883.1 hypothetical protein [Brevibacillus laterosporus]MCZ0830611.1 hypothetical protein [Brevibacillus halotolerans]